MQIELRKRILSSIKKLLAGIVRLCLRNGVTYKELAALFKGLYVDIAAKEYGIQGRATNISRIALMTGLDRKEIRKILSELEDVEDATPMQPDRIAKILTAWHKDSHYLDVNQKPLAIPSEGKAPSFEHLAKTFGGDMPTVTILKELKRSQTIIENDEGLLEVKKTYFVPNYLATTDEAPELVDPAAIEHGSSMLVDHINTIFHNLYRKDKSLRKRMELRATDTTIPKDKVPEFYKLVDEKAMKVLHEVNDWLEDNKSELETEEKERLGLGVYFIQGENQNIKIEEK